MPLRYADRVLETSTTTGTGDLTLAAAVTGYQRFSAVCTTADVVYYAAWDVDGNGNPSGSWETGRGTYSAANTLTRTTVLASSNAGAAVNFAAGTRRVGMTPVAADYGASGIILAQSAAASAHTGTTAETTLATVTLPAGLLGANGRIEMRSDWTHTNSANLKTFRLKFGGTSTSSFTSTTTTGGLIDSEVSNRNATNSQRYNSRRLNSAAAGSYNVGTAAIDTTAAVTILLTGQLALGSETVTLEAYQVLVYPKV